MNKLTEETTDHQYLLHVVWNDDHGRSDHRVIHSVWEGEWDPRGILEKFVGDEYPQWLPEGRGPIAHFKDGVYVSCITVFKVLEGARDELLWETWLQETKAARCVVDKEREREADMLTIKRLQEKWSC